MDSPANKLRSAFLWWVALLLWAAVIFVLSSREPGHLPPLRMAHADKIVHFFAFAAGACIFTTALRLSVPWTRKRLALVAIAGISLYGAFDEWHQLSTPGRSGGDRGDWLADTAGAITGALVVSYAYARYRAARRPPADLGTAPAD